MSKPASEITAADLHRATAAFVLTLMGHFPPQFAESMAGRLHEMADMIEHGGDTTVGRLTRGFAHACEQRKDIPSR